MEPKKILLGSMLLMLIVAVATPVASANLAECRASVGPINVECKTDHGGCAAGAYSSPNGHQAAGCAATDYERDDD